LTDVDVVGEPTVPREVQELLTWLAVERGRSPNTLSAYRRDLVAYWGWLRARGVASLADATPDDVASHVGHLRAEGRAPATVARATVAIRGLHRFLADEGLAPSDPGSDLDPPRVPAGLPKALTEDEVNRLLGAVVGDEPVARRDRAILEVLYGTGLRISELVGLGLSDVDLDGALLRALGKGRKERIVPLGRPARRALEEWLDDPGRGALVAERRGRGVRRDDVEAVFLNGRGGRLTRQGAWLVVRRHGDRVGLGDRLTPHVLRHSYATHLLDHGADIRIVQELLGHASISTTQVYTKVSTERLWAVYDAAHPRAKRSAPLADASASRRTRGRAGRTSASR
jgi:integrase/recombinase XerD